MDKRVLRERMRRKQQQIRRRRMMKRITCVVAAILLLVFVVRGVILPIVNRVGGGSSKGTETVNVQANTAGTSLDGSTEDASASADSATSDSSGDSSTDAVVMPIKGSTAGDRLSVMTPGWHEDSTGKWYQNPDGTYYINGFAEIDGTTYSFDENGYMQTGWVEKGVKDYYFNEDGSYDPSKKRPMIALTFDDGPNARYTPMLLDELKKRNIRASFFLIGENIEGNEDILLQMRKDGHLIGNHTWDHVQLDKIPAEKARLEIEKTNNRIYEASGIYPSYVRPPFGAWIKDMELSVTMLPVFWDVDTLDWKSKNIDSILSIAQKQVHDGSIILMHDSYQTSVDAALKIADLFTEKGYVFVTADQLLLT